jgi:S-adenosylmethionine-dependent methyltransferase
MQDKNFVSFESLNDTFHRNICDSTKGRIRRAVVEKDLCTVAGALKNSRPALLDAGCGDGYMCGFMLEQIPECEAVLCDVSADALDRARARLDSSRCSFYEADIFNLPSAVTEKRFDIILCHAVIEWVRDQRKCINVLKGQLAPGGVLSLLYYNRDALLFQSLVVGNFPYVYSGLKSRHRQKMTPLYPVSPYDMDEWITDSGLEIISESGVRVFHDYMRHKNEYEEKFDDIRHFELEYSRDERFRRLGRYIHLILRSPDDEQQFGNCT